MQLLTAEEACRNVPRGRTTAPLSNNICDRPPSDSNLSTDVDEWEKRKKMDNLLSHDLPVFIFSARARLSSRLSNLLQTLFAWRKMWQGRGRLVIYARHDGWYMRLPSCVLPLNTTSKNIVFKIAIPHEHRKWNDHRGIWANCVAANGEIIAPNPALV